MNVVIRTIDLGVVKDLNAEIKNLCVVMAASGCNLASTFVFRNQLVLIFQG